MRFHVAHLAEYERKLKIQSEKIRCYKKKQLKDKYPDKNYLLVGETRKLAKEEERDRDTACYSPNVELELGDYKDNSRILYREAGYLSVGGNRYIAVLKSRIPILLLWLFGLLVLGVALFFLLHPPKAPADLPKLIPIPDKDPYVQAIPDDGSEEMETQTNKVSMTYVLKAKTSLSTGEVGIYFANPYRSNQDVVLELYINSGEEKILLATSGLIPRGNNLLKMTADQDTLSRLSIGNFDAFFRVTCYDSETGEKAIVQPEITDVILTVIA